MERMGRCRFFMIAFSIYWVLTYFMVMSYYHSESAQLPTDIKQDILDAKENEKQLKSMLSHQMHSMRSFSSNVPERNKKPIIDRGGEGNKVDILKQARNYPKTFSIMSKMPSPPELTVPLHSFHINKPQLMQPSSSSSSSSSLLLDIRASKMRNSMRSLISDMACFKLNDETGINHCLPDYLLIGFPKCGSSSMWRYLKQHPQVCVRVCSSIRFCVYMCVLRLSFLFVYHIIIFYQPNINI
jgi:hypothetical protein